MTKKNCRIAFVLALTVIFAVLFSAGFVIAEADHDCAGEGCLICCQISVCENILKDAGVAFVLVICAAFIGIAAISLPLFAKKPVYSTSLVALRVKLSN